MQTANTMTAVMAVLVYVIGQDSANARGLQADMTMMQGMAPSSSSVMAPSPSAQLENIMASTDSAMMAVKPCSNADRFFAESMIPHHQGAIKMAQWEVQYGSNPNLLDISRNIISSQTQEVTQMQGYLAQLPVPADCAPAMAPSAPAMMTDGMAMNMPGMDMSGIGSSMSGMSGMGSMSGMQMDTPAPSTSSAALTPSESAMMGSMNGMMAPTGAPLSGNPDRDYAIEMSAHHQAAIDMAKVELQYGTYQPLLQLAKQIIAAQTQEITQFKAILVHEYSTPYNLAAGGR